MSSNKKILYHTGFSIIREPDLKRGRLNSDFGQGFYLSDDQEFSLRWARDHKGSETYINTYELETDGLAIRHFEREKEWLEFILNNRSNYDQRQPDADLISGPIANDTLFETYGIISSGIYDTDQALKLLQIGPCYLQYVIKSEKALKQLRWLKAEMIEKDVIRKLRDKVSEEEKHYQEELVRAMEMMDKTE